MAVYEMNTVHSAQTSLYESYQQRETEAKTTNVNMRNRFATLTSDWINRPAIPPLQNGQASGHAAPTNASAAPHTGTSPKASPTTTTPACDVFASATQAELHGREYVGAGDATGQRSGVQGHAGRSGPLAGVFSRSVGLVTSLAQHISGLRSRRGTGEAPHSRHNSRSGSALLSELLQMDSKQACQQALTITALHQNFLQAGLAHSARFELVEQVVKAGVVSSCAPAVAMWCCMP
jgi:hypothetical protein